MSREMGSFYKTIKGVTFHPRYINLDIFLKLLWVNRPPKIRPGE